MLAHPVELCPHAGEVLECLSADYRLVLITKGDLFDQERKVAESGLRGYFEAVEIVADKDRATYERIFSRHGPGPDAAVMIGNFAAVGRPSRHGGGELGYPCSA
jgi:putative hydrolase of the HAD superfamily